MGRQRRDPRLPGVAPPGTYILQLVAGIGGPSCAGGPSPSFGFNNGSSMDYLLVGNG